MLASGLGAIAQGTFSGVSEIEWNDRQAFLLMPNGTVRTTRTNDAGHTMLMKYGRELSASTAIYRSGGKYYVIENQRQPNGTWMFDPAMVNMSSGP